MNEPSVLPARGDCIRLAASRVNSCGHVVTATMLLSRRQLSLSSSPRDIVSMAANGLVDAVNKALKEGCKTCGEPVSGEQQLSA